MHLLHIITQLCILTYVTCICSAHNSAGPKTDIISTEDGKQVGYLAQYVEEYTDAILKVIRMPESERLEMADAARQRASRFSAERFYRHYKIIMQRILCHSKE